MRYLIFFIILAVAGCATSDIIVNKDAMKSLKSVAITPFKSTIKLKKEVLTESECIFKTAFIKMNYKVVDTEKLAALSKGKETDISLSAAENAEKTGKLAGADAVLFGEIIKYEEETREVMFSHKFFNAGVFSNKSNDELRYVTTYKFQIIIRLVDASDGKEILILKNRYKEIEQEENLQCCNSLDSYRKYIVNKIADELVEAMKEKN